jgi:hypothetical protein
MTGQALSNSILRGTAVLGALICLFSSNFAGSAALGAGRLLKQSLRPSSKHVCNKASAKSCTHEDLSEACIMSVLRKNIAVRQYGDLTAGLEVRFNGESLELARWQDSTQNDKQIKQQAAAMAAAIDGHFAGVFEAVDCFFFDAHEPSAVRRAHISLSAFKASTTPSVAQLAEVCLLSRERAVSLSDLYKTQTYRQILQQAPVLEGTFSAERKELSEQLITLKANGYDVNQAMGQFFAVEDLVRTRNYENVYQALATTRQSITSAVARAKTPQWQNPNTSVASSRTEGWQR